MFVSSYHDNNYHFTDHPAVKNLEKIYTANAGKRFNDLLSFSPQIAATENGDVCVVWDEKNSTSGDSDITLRISHDSGMNFNKLINLNIGETKYYKYTVGLSAKDVNQLHSKVSYYDSNMKQVSNYDLANKERESGFIFDGRDGTFNDTITTILSIPPNTSFIKLQMLVHPNLKNSSYVLHDAMILPTTLEKTITWTNDNNDTQTISISADEVTGQNNSLRVNVGKGDSTDWSVISSGFIPVREIVYRSFSPQIATTENEDLYVIWADTDVQLKQVVDSDNTVGETISISNKTKLSLSPQVVATEKGDVYVLWMGKNNTTDDEVLLFKRISKMRS